MKKLFLLTALFVAAAFPSCSKHDGVETPDLPDPQPLAIVFAEGNSLEFNVGETKTVHYTITGGSANNVVKAELQTLDDAYTVETTPTSAAEGTITITAKKPSNENRIIVTVSNGSQTIMAAIDVTIKLKASFDGKTVEVKTAGTLSKLLADYDKTTITDLTVIGNLNDKDIATLEKLPNLAVLDMEHVNLKAFPVLFYEKTSLISIKLPLTLKTIRNSSFRGCINLTSITIPDSVTSIEAYAFIDCNSLTGVYITDIAKWCAIEFYWGSSNPLVYAQNLYLNGELITDELVIPDSVTSIESNVFSNYSRLTSVTIPDSVTSIGRSAFSNCSSLTNVTIGNGVTTIGNAAFQYCSSLTSITIPDSVTSIGERAFEDCRGLTSVTIGNGVTTIGHYAFYGCSGLTSVTIGSGVTSIERYAFVAAMPRTINIYCKAKTPPTAKDSIFNGWGLSTLYTPTGCKEAYAAADEWKKAKEIIEIEF